MTVGSRKVATGRLLTVNGEYESGTDSASIVSFTEGIGTINANLSIGADVGGTVPLKANCGLSFMGVTPVGGGFLVSMDQAKSLGLGRLPQAEKYIRPFRNGKDI